MFDENLQTQLAFVEKSRDIPHTVNNFDGVWNISDHSLIPPVLRLFIQYSFKTGKINRIPMESINSLLNEVWQGPGSLETVLRLQHEMSDSVNFSNNDVPRVRAIKLFNDTAPVADQSRVGSDFEGND